MKNIYQTLGIKSVLFVGNDPWLRDTLSLFLNLQGCDVHSSDNLTEADERISSERYDLILCRDRVSEMDGLPFLSRCADCQPGAIRFLIAAYSNHLMMDETASLGIEDVLKMPFAVDALESSLRRLVRNAGGRPGRDEETV